MKLAIFIAFDIVLLIPTFVTCAFNDFTNEELILIEELRNETIKDALYKPYMRENVYLVRWLRAQKHDVQEASNMLRKAHKWRIENKMDSILKEDWSSVRKQLPYRDDGFDKYGQPIIETSAGKFNTRKFILSGQRELYNKYITRMYELMTTKVRHISESTGNPNITQYIVLMDMSGYSLRLHACIACIPAHLQTVTDFDSYYPMAVKEFHLVNTPRTFEGLLQLMKNVMSQDYQKALHVHGINKEEWKRVILKNISPNQVLPAFGGTKS